LNKKKAQGLFQKFSVSNLIGLLGIKPRLHPPHGRVPAFPAGRRKGGYHYTTARYPKKTVIYYIQK